MAETPASLNEMSRRDLSELAKNLGIADAEVMTRAELRASIERSQSTPRVAQPPWPTTWLGVARGLIASIVEQGLNLPDAAALIRGDTKLSTPPKPSPPVATVTLARIYAAQGHVQRAIDTLNEVLRSDPDHELALDLRNEFAARHELTARKGRGASASPPLSSGEPASTPGEVAAVSSPTDVAPISSASQPAAESPAPSAHLEPAAASATAPEPVPPSEPPPTLEERLPALAQASIAAPSEPATAVKAEAEPAPPKRAAAPRFVPRPAAAELVLIETDAPAAYVYWELSATPSLALSPEQCSLLLVAYTPQATGAQRVERRLSLTSTSGALRLTGLPEHAVLRALLTRDSAAQPGNSHAQNGAAAPKPLAVAGAVRAQEPPRDPAIHVLFCPSRHHNPADVAVRAIDHLAQASSLAW
jgi:hypothetical protein